MKLLEGPKHNLIDELFTPNFESCKLYRRQTAFFQPSVFKSWGSSIKSIVDNETKLEILMAVSEQNFKILNAINNLQTKDEKNKLLAKEANSFFEQCLGLNNSTSDYENRRRLIRYLYAKEQLEIKLCISCDENQENLSLSHNKMGYFVNKNDDYVSFMGSANESDSALMRHGEDLAVYDSKETLDYESAKKFKEVLDKKWDETDPHNIVFKPTKEFIKKIKIISDIKDKREALKVTKEILEEMGFINQEEIKLRKHQIDAIKAWDENGKKGILAHATGSGKTITALATIKNLRKNISNESLVVLVGVPFVPLADQWLDQLNDLFFKEKEKDKFVFNGTVGCYTGQSNWRIKAEKELLLFQESLSRGEAHLSIILVVNRTLVDEEFKTLFDKVNLNSKRLFIIGDECHRYTQENPRKALPEAEYKMGLSATPFNDTIKTDQEKEMDTFFGGICHKYSLKNGITDKHLCKYYYYPKECFLDEEEFFKWKEYLDRGDSNDDHLKEMEEIIDGSKEKYKAFESLIKDIKDKEHTIIFSGESKKDGIRSIDYISEILTNNSWGHQKITYEESPKERKEIINGFERGDIKVISAMRVLDEGIDIPAIKKAIILASSRFRRQFVQRRGRVLRNDEVNNKKFAEIYDFIILPNSNFTDQGKNLINREIARVEEMGQDAINKKDIDNFVKKYRGLYEI